MSSEGHDNNQPNDVVKKRMNDLVKRRSEEEIEISKEAFEDLAQSFRKLNEIYQKEIDIHNKQLASLYDERYTLHQEIKRLQMNISENISTIKSPKNRFKYIFNKDIFVILGIVGSVISMIFAAYSIFFSGDVLSFEEPSLFSTAFAQQMRNTETLGFFPSKEEVRIQVIYGIFVMLFLFFVWAMFTLSFSQRAVAIEIAKEGTKMVGGFAVGAITGFMGG